MQFTLKEYCSYSAFEKIKIRENEVILKVVLHVRAIIDLTSTDLSILVYC